MVERGLCFPDFHSIYYTTLGIQLGMSKSNCPTLLAPKPTVPFHASSVCSQELLKCILKFELLCVVLYVCPSQIYTSFNIFSPNRLLLLYILFLLTKAYVGICLNFIDFWNVCILKFLNISTHPEHIASLGNKWILEARCILFWFASLRRWI